MSEDYEPSILSQLKSSHIFSITPVMAGGFEIIEECDMYYSTHLSSDQLKTLANELLELAE